MLDVTRADLAPHTTLRLGGPAGRLVVASIQDEILQIVRDGERAGAPPLVLAGGSNVVVSDEGVAGTVLLLRTSGIRLGPAGAGEVLVIVEAGQDWDEVGAWAVAEGLVGIECLSGVPGSAGATPIQNVGAYGQEVAETIASVRVLDRTRGDVCDMSPAECRFAYRSSVFRHNDRHVVIALRAGKGMVLDPSDPDTDSIGSFFVNPVLDPSAYASLRGRSVEHLGEEPTRWPADGGDVKVSAAWLIERAGFVKGYAGSHPGVSISTKHTLALTNRGTGTAAALIGLAREIRDGVAKAFDVELRPEPVLVGCAL